MTPRRAHAPAAALALAIAGASGCATQLAADAPRAINGLTILPYETHRECARLGVDDRLEYTFETTEPVAFEVRYFEGAATLAPIVRESTRADAGVFVAAEAREYCLVWEAGGTGTLIDYRVRLRPATR